MKSLALLFLFALLWFVGLVAFADRAAKATPAEQPARADAIVALTGASSVRIEAATRLLELGFGKRLLISGVNKGVTRAELKAVSRGAGRAYDCCVDLGRGAENTQGNARETSAWVRGHKYKSLIVVTSDYHMPRSMLELEAALPGVELTPYPTPSDIDPRAWWKRGDQARRLMVEYTKYLTILGRNALLAGGRKASPELGANAAAAGA